MVVYIQSNSPFDAPLNHRGDGTFRFAIQNEIGMAFLPVIYIPKEIEHKSLHALGPLKGFWRYSIWLASHVTNQNNSLVQSLGEAFKEVCLPLIERR